jgi:DNA-binding transcriptional LysR family regulator
VNEPGNVNLDLVLGDDSIDIVAEGYDAGIRLGEVIVGDMIAEPISGDLRLLVVGAPSYFARRTKPAHPRDLADHDCINWHATAAAKPYRWEFTEKGREFSTPFPGFYLYYPQLRRASPSLRALVAHLRALRLPKRRTVVRAPSQSDRWRR